MKNHPLLTASPPGSASSVACRLTEEHHCCPARDWPACSQCCWPGLAHPQHAGAEQPYPLACPGSVNIPLPSPVDCKSLTRNPLCWMRCTGVPRTLTWGGRVLPPPDGMNQLHPAHRLAAPCTAALSALRLRPRRCALCRASPASAACRLPGLPCPQLHSLLTGQRPFPLLSVRPPMLIMMGHVPSRRPHVWSCSPRRAAAGSNMLTLYSNRRRSWREPAGRQQR